MLVLGNAKNTGQGRWGSLTLLDINNIIGVLFKPFDQSYRTAIL